MMIVEAIRSVTHLSIVEARCDEVRRGLVVQQQAQVLVRGSALKIDTVEISSRIQFYFFIL